MGIFLELGMRLDMGPDIGLGIGQYMEQGIGLGMVLRM